MVHAVWNTYLLWHPFAAIARTNCSLLFTSYGQSLKCIEMRHSARRTLCLPMCAVCCALWFGNALAKKISHLNWFGIDNVENNRDIGYKYRADSVFRLRFDESLRQIAISQLSRFTHQIFMLIAFFCCLFFFLCLYSVASHVEMKVLPASSGFTKPSRAQHKTQLP